MKRCPHCGTELIEVPAVLNYYLSDAHGCRPVVEAILVCTVCPDVFAEERVACPA